MFRPEFLNRLDETIVFTQLGRPEIQAIAGGCWSGWGSGCAPWASPSASPTPPWRCWPTRASTRDYGARPLRRTIRAQVEDVAAEKLLSGAVQAGDTVLVDGSEGALRLEIPPAAVQALNTKEEPT